MSNFPPRIFSGLLWLVWNGSYERKRQNGGKTDCGLRMGILHEGLWKWFLLQLTSLNFTSEGDWRQKWSEGFLQMTDLYLLRGRDCKKMGRVLHVEQLLGLSEEDWFLKRAGYWQAGGVFQPIPLLFSFVPVKRFQDQESLCSSLTSTRRNAKSWLSRRQIPWRAGSHHVIRWAQKESYWVWL